MANITGTNKNDRGAKALLGTEDADVILGLAGHDQIYALGGDDEIDAGDGNDLVVAGDGSDYVLGGAGNDHILGGNGMDILKGEAGNDRIEGGADRDFISGGDGNDRLFGGDGNDTIGGDAGNDRLYGNAGNDRLIGGEGNDLMRGGDGDDIMDGGAGNDHMYGGAGNDFMVGGTGNDEMKGGAGDDILLGEDGNDSLFGGNDQDILIGGEGNDYLNGGKGHDLLIGGEGNDTEVGGRGRDYLLGMEGNDDLSGGGHGDILLGGAGNDALRGGGHNDYVHGGEGNDSVAGNSGHDMLSGGAGNDSIAGGRGADGILDGAGNDHVQGGGGRDTLANGRGNDVLNGGRGNDVLVSYSDAGEPDIAQETDAARVNGDEPFADANDTLTGGAGRDTFLFQLNIDAKDEIIAEHTDANTGRIDWSGAGIAGENDNPHDHWVDGIGTDTITDYNAGKDSIVIEGHTVDVAVSQVDEDDDGVRDYSLITLTSNQGGNGGAHDGDSLGFIKVYGDEVTADDIASDAGVFYGEDTFEGLIPVYGDAGNNEISDGRGAQVLFGYQGDDTLVAYGDGGEPEPAQGGDRAYPYETDDYAGDTLIGGDGADTFMFKPLINARQEIIDKHTDEDGVIDWTGSGIAGENDNVHDHWVEGVGNDVVYDFNADEGDQIVIEGHTTRIEIEHFDSTFDDDDEVDYTVISLFSDQGGNGGAHDGDALGTITVWDAVLTEADISVDAGVFHAVDQLEGWA
jgi:Ca2+-binding RTX toxin-like protein